MVGGGPGRASVPARRKFWGPRWPIASVLASGQGGRQPHGKRRGARAAPRCDARSPGCQCAVAEATSWRGARTNGWHDVEGRRGTTAVAPVRRSWSVLAPAGLLRTWSRAGSRSTWVHHSCAVRLVPCWQLSAVRRAEARAVRPRVRVHRHLIAGLPKIKFYHESLPTARAPPLSVVGILMKSSVYRPYRRYTDMSVTCNG